MAKVEMHVLRFEGRDPVSEKRFEVCYHGNMGGGKTSGRKHRKRVLAIRGKLEEVGVCIEIAARDQVGGEAFVERWRLRPEGGEVVLEQAEYDELQERIDKYGDQLYPQAARDLEETLEWLEANRMVELQPKTAEPTTADVERATAIEEELEEIDEELEGE